MTNNKLILRKMIAAAICLTVFFANSLLAQSIPYNKVFGGSGTDYLNSNSGNFYDILMPKTIRISIDGTIWMCGSTTSNDGDLTVPGNRGGVDAWLLNIDPKTNQILYNRTFGGSGYDEFCSFVLMDDSTIWLAGTTSSSDGDLTSVTVKGGKDGWVMHLDPKTDKILHNRHIGGYADDFFYNIAPSIDGNTIWLCGEAFSANGDNSGIGHHGAGFTDAWLVAIDAKSGALKYNRCFGSSHYDAFCAIQPMSDGTVWCAGYTRGPDGDIEKALVGNHGTHDGLSKYDGWIMHIDPNAVWGGQILYNRCFGGTSDDTFDAMSVLSDGTIWLKGRAYLFFADGDLTAAGCHGANDVWLVKVDPNLDLASQITYNRCFGGSKDDGIGYSNFVVAPDGTIWVTAETKSTDGDLSVAGNKGGKDIWIFNLDPVTNHFNYNRTFGGSGDEVCPNIALDAVEGTIWVVCGTESNNTGDVPATKGGRDLWLFSPNYGGNIGKLYTLTFAGEEINIEPQKVLEGELATKPTDPIRTGYNFRGWFTDNNTFLNQWNFETCVVTQDTTLWAKWTKKTTGLEQLKNKNYELQIYPNPVKNELTIDNGELTINNVEICDIYGRNVHSFSRSLVYTIDISHLPKGIYFIKLETDKGIITQKFVKE